MSNADIIREQNRLEAIDLSKQLAKAGGNLLLIPAKQGEGMNYPEHEKLKALDGKNQVIGDFLEWLRDKELEICEWHDDMEEFYALRFSTESLIARYFDIDPQKLEDEKLQMLEEIRAFNEEKEKV